MLLAFLDICVYIHILQRPLCSVYRLFHESCLVCPLAALTQVPFYFILLQLPLNCIHISHAVDLRTLQDPASQHYQLILFLSSVVSRFVWFSFCNVSTGCFNYAFGQWSLFIFRFYRTTFTCPTLIVPVTAAFCFPFFWKTHIYPLLFHLSLSIPLGLTIILDSSLQSSSCSL